MSKPKMCLLWQKMQCLRGAFPFVLLCLQQSCHYLANNDPIFARHLAALFFSSCDVKGTYCIGPHLSSGAIRRINTFEESSDGDPGMCRFSQDIYNTYTETLQQNFACQRLDLFLFRHSWAGGSLALVTSALTAKFKTRTRASMGRPWIFLSDMR
jgi:hypothetical protein